MESSLFTGKNHNISGQQFVLKNLPVIFWTTDEELRLTSSSGAALHKLDLVSEQMMGMRLEAFLKSSDPQNPSIQKHRQALKGEIVDYEDRFRGCFWNIHVEPLINESGDVIGTVALALDVSDYKNAEEALARERNLLRTLVDHLPVSIYAKDRQARKTLANPLDVRYCGCECEADLLGKSDIELFPNEMAAQFLFDDFKVLDEGQVILNREEQLRDRDGAVVWLNTSKLPLRDANGNIIGLIGMGVDITKRRQMEMSLRESEARFKAVSEYSHNAICLVDEGGKIVWVNEAFLKMGGYSREKAFSTASFVDFLAPESVEFVVSNLMKFVKKETYEHHFSFYLMRADGQQRLCETHMTDYEGQEGKRVLAISMIDVTEHKLAEEALRESEEKFRTITENSFDMVALLDMNACYLYCNQSYTDILKYEPDALLGSCAMEIVHPDDKEDVVKLFHQILVNMEMADQLSGQPIMFRLNCQDGSHKWVEHRFRFLRDEFGSPQRILINAQDITDRKQAEEALRESEEKFRQIVEQSNDVFYRQNIHSAQFEYVSPKVMDVLGMTPEEFLLLTYEEQVTSIHPDDLPSLKYFREDLIKAESAGEKSISREFRLKNKQGEYRWIHGNYTLLRDEENNPYLILGSLNDITERKRAEEALRLSEEKYSKAFHISPDSININRMKDGLYLAINEGFTALTDYTPEDVFGKTSIELDIWVDPQDRQRLVQGLREYGEVWNLEAPFRTKNGTIKICLMSARIIEVNGENCILSITRDITERKQVEEALRSLAESGGVSGEDIFHFLVHRLAVALDKRYAMLAFLDQQNPDISHTLAVWSGDQFADNFSYSLIGTPCQDVTKKGACLFTSGARALFPEDRLLVEMEADSYMGTPLRDSTGKVIGIMAVLDDRPIEENAQARELLGSFAARAAVELERKQAEQALRESEEKFTTAFRVIPEMIYIEDMQTAEILEVNEAFLHTTGYSRAEVLGKSMSGLGLWINPETEDYLRVTLKAEKSIRSFETEIQDRTGEPFWVEIASDEITFSGRACLIVAARDVTQRKNLEKTLVESEKMAGIGTLAAGIAHEINTPLQIITGVADSLLREWRNKQDVLPQDLERRLENVSRNGWRIAAIVRSLLDYARSSPGQIESISLNDIVEHTLLLIEHQLKSWDNITVTTELDDSIPPVMCDRNQITQVMINLLTNARDAMPEGGWITIRSSYDENAQMAILRVADSGKGIPPDIRDKIFDPFFTTKPIGEGTGLGLSISIGILRAMGGSLELETSSKQGSIFKLCLPLKPKVMVEVTPGRFKN